MGEYVVVYSDMDAPDAGLQCFYCEAESVKQAIEHFILRHGHQPVCEIAVPVTEPWESPL